MDEILKILEEDGRTTAQMIADQLDIQVEVVEAKIKEYEDSGVIVRYKTVLNGEKLSEGSLDVRALIEVCVKPEKDKGFDALAEKIYRFPEVVTCMLVSGSFDLLLEVRGETIQTVSRFVTEKLSLIENVQSTRTHFILKKYKEGGDIFAPAIIDQRLAVSP